MKRQLSKRSGLENIGKDIMDNVWRDDLGPIANLLSLGSYAMPFVPGLGWGMLIFEKIAGAFGYGLVDLGRYLDKEFSLSPGDNLEIDDKNMSEILAKGLKLKHAVPTSGLTKEAGLLTIILGLAKKSPFLVRLLMKLSTWLLTATGAKSISSLYNRTEPVDSDLTGGNDSAVKEDDKPDLGVEDMLGMTKILDPSVLKSIMNLGGKL